MESISRNQEQPMVDQVYTKNGEIIVRTARIGDAALIVDYFEKNRRFLKPWEPSRDEAFFSINTWRQRLIKLHELHQIALGYYLIILSVDKEEMLGTISFSQVARFPMYSCNVGYSLAETAQGRGVMTKALTMACNYMFEKQNMHRICAAFMPRNHKSEQVLRRVGFKNEGKADNYLLIDGKWEDHILMALHNPDWKENE
ncbi:ribosomal protein S5-alanine N-acetyltransferase [Vibrio salinus]|uniref:ribosomal protein S5-alanine N-acetyltransferase n=1 Tax=Vibrio salinus TaxID=2899784 RepID=UPI001E55B051|nr:ribosomal protein S5-alanine N-acetyltransferase [Vibrio salinus]MCE0492461.1 ribosomal protein S5-alanine N-acetyltransferase [Vibrio salinus]